MKIEKIQTIILQSLKKYSEQSSIKLKINDIADTPIFGEDSALDSLGLVTLLVEVEQSIEDEFSQEITIADEKAMSLRNSPFRNVETLSNYIETLIVE